MGDFDGTAGGSMVVIVDTDAQRQIRVSVNMSRDRMMDGVEAKGAGEKG